MEQNLIEKSILDIMIKSKIPLLAREICVLLNIEHPGKNFTKPQVRSIIWGNNLRKEIKYDSVSFKYFLRSTPKKPDVISNKDHLICDFKDSKNNMIFHVDFEKLKKIFEEEELRISNPSIRLFIENVLFRLKND